VETFLSSQPRVVIGVPLFNGATHLRAALDSLLGQRFTDYALVLLDDCSTDETPAIAAEYAARDPRVSFERHERRLGMMRNWRAVFERATRLHPSAAYFAWASDHDLWDPEWLATLMDVLETQTNVVLTYPRVERCDELDQALELDGRSFDSTTISDRRERLRFTALRMPAGNIVYGLFRLETLRRCAVFSSVLLPDRLLLAELSLYGAFHQVERPLWRRRYRRGETASLERQRRSFYPDGAPLRSHLPWVLTHCAVLVWRLGIRGSGRPDIGRTTGVHLALDYLPPAYRKYAKELGETALFSRFRMAYKRARSFVRRQHHRIVHHTRRLARLSGWVKDD
jgi:glycosyltransferase involved in cell wall biosynthesis